MIWTIKMRQRKNKTEKDKAKIEEAWENNPKKDDKKMAKKTLLQMIKIII